MRVTILVLLVCFGCAGGSQNQLIRSRIAHEVPWRVTSQPDGAVVSVVVTNEGTSGEGHFTVTTPYNEQNDEGLVEWVVTPDGVRHRQIWHITVTKVGYQTLTKEVFSTELPELMHFDLVPEGHAVAVSTTPSTQAPKEHLVLAVFDVEDKSGKIDREVLEQLSDYLATRLSELGGFQVVPRSDLRARLAESKADSFRACFDEACQIELGKALAAQVVLSTRILKVGNQCALSSNLQNLKTETSVAAASVRTDCSTNNLMDAADKLADDLAKKR